MFNLSGSEIVVILLLALVILGPEKLPDFLRRAGRTYAELKRMGNSFQTEMKSVLDEPMKEMRETADLLQKSARLEDPETSTPAAGRRASPAPPKPVVRQPPETTEAPESTDESPTNETISGGSAPVEQQPPTSDGDALINRTLSGAADPPADHTAGPPVEDPSVDEARTT